MCQVFFLKKCCSNSSPPPPGFVLIVSFTTMELWDVSLFLTSHVTYKFIITQMNNITYFKTFKLKFCASLSNCLWFIVYLFIYLECGGEVTSSAGRITSPSYPRYYTSGLRCQYKIRRPEPSTCTVELDFRSFDLANSPGCSEDYLQLPDNSRLCGSQLAPST